MCHLSKQEKEVLEMLLGAVPSVVCLRLKIKEGHLASIKTRVRRKEAKAKKFLRDQRKYRSILHPAKRYKGLE